jgi:uncharacterized membrane protein YfcA
MEIIGALIAGGAIGAVLGFVGAGGAMLSVPILMYGFGFDAKSATTAALAVVLLAALSGAIPKARKGQILYRDALVIVGLGLVTNLSKIFLTHLSRLGLQRCLSWQGYRCCVPPNLASRLACPSQFSS